MRRPGSGAAIARYGSLGLRETSLPHLAKLRPEYMHLVRREELTLYLVAERTAWIEVVEAVRDIVVTAINPYHLEPLLRSGVDDV
jgi:hypothetical protein